MTGFVVRKITVHVFSIFFNQQTIALVTLNIELEFCHFCIHPRYIHFRIDLQFSEYMRNLPNLGGGGNNPPPYGPGKLLHLNVIRYIDNSVSKWVRVKRGMDESVNSGRTDG